MARPDFEQITTGAEFNRWYWLKNEMVALCKTMGLPYSGSKFELRDRIMYALDHDGALLPAPKKRTKSGFNWAKAELTPETVITDNVTFGQNLRRFMKRQVGEHFAFNTDFMAWVKAHVGHTLAQAVKKWHQLEARKSDPSFRTEIAQHNMYNQYTRDFLDDNPELTPGDARRCWLLKKQLPTEDGFIRYHPDDLALE
ncbi:MAG: DUF6434 domain-containing protein [Bacteroidota bacterium]